VVSETSQQRKRARARALAAYETGGLAHGICTDCDQPCTGQRFGVEQNSGGGRTLVTCEPCLRRLRDRQQAEDPGTTRQQAAAARKALRRALA
jgi:hypothetical protein